jgi:hypothetical protein
MDHRIGREDTSALRAMVCGMERLLEAWKGTAAGYRGEPVGQYTTEME